MSKLDIVLESFASNLPKKPYCTDNLYSGLKIRPKANAILKRYIQPNHPYYTKYFVFDLDSESSYVDYFYSMVGVPAPNLIIENTDNGHAHFLYELETPIYKTDASKIKPIQYANAVYNALRLALDADVGYSGLITKNALHTHWRSHTLREKPYTLDQLSERLDLTQKQINKEVKIDEAVGLGRNCCVFNIVRHWSYIEVRQYRSKTFNQWLQAVIDRCSSINIQFSEPMTHNEVKCIAKSISRWTWKRDAYCYQEFVDRQSRKGHLGGLKGGKARSSKYESKRIQALKMKHSGMNNTQIAQALEVDRRTVGRWFNLK